MPGPHTIRTLAIMLLTPPLLLLLCAHVFPGSMRSSWVMGTLFALIGLAALAALATSRWPLRARLGAGALWLLCAIPAVPLTALLAVCSTGDCL
jgi:hypothetical protein